MLNQYYNQLCVRELKLDQGADDKKSFFLRIYSANHMYKPIPIEDKFKKTGFSSPKALLFWLKIEVSCRLVTS